MAFLFGLMGRGWSKLGGASAGKSRGGPFLLLSDGASRLLLQNAVARLLITGLAPSGSYVPTYYLLGF